MMGPHCTILIYMMKKMFFLLAMFTCFFASCSDGGDDDPVAPPASKPEVNNPTITLDSSIQANGLSFDTSASEKSITFTTTSDWTLSIAETRSGTAWCTASPTSGGKGTSTVKFTTTENTEPEDRSVAVTIKAGTASKTFTVTQKGNKSLLVTAKKYELPKEGGEIEIEVKANVEYEMTIAESAKEWITEATARAMTTHKHILTVSASEEAVKREGEIIFKSGDIVETVKVYQAGEAVLLLSKNEFTVSEAGETISVDIKSNVEFGIQMPDADWIKEDASGRGMSSHTLKFVVTENETSETRSAEIVFYDKNSDLKNTLKVTQNGGRVVTLVEAGSLKELFMVDYLNISKVKIVGPINGDDIYYLRKMLGASTFSEADWGKLTTLDLSESRIVEGGGYYYVRDSYKMYTRNDIMDDKMFEECANLQNIILPDNIIYIYYSVFQGCKKLETIKIPDSVIYVGRWAFENCEALTSVTIGKGVTKIGSSAFRDCWNMTSLFISDLSAWCKIDFESGDSHPFGNTKLSGSVSEYVVGKIYLENEELTELVIPEDITEIKQCSFFGCGNIKKVIIHDQVTSMEEAFINCFGVTSVIIGKSVTNVNSNFFGSEWKSSITECYCYATTPPSGTIYARKENSPTLYVPARCGAAYKTSEFGAYFENIIEMD